MPRMFDRVKETSTTNGTGAITLAGAANQYVAFSTVCAVGDQNIPYAIVGQTGAEWEVGLGVYSAANTLTRDLVLASSNANAVVNLSAGTKDVFLTINAENAKPSGRMTMVARGGALPG